MASFKILRGSGTLPALILLALLIGSAQPASAQCADLPDCVLVWSDEFDGTEVDLSRWTFQLGDGQGDVCDDDDDDDGGGFVSSVAHLMNAARKAGLIRGAQKGAVVSCAASSAVP